MLHWTDPIILKQYCKAPRGQGVYVIGGPNDPSQAITPCAERDSYLANWPKNFRPYYVGNSFSNGSGIRGRLSSHARQKGNKAIAQRVARGEILQFITISGQSAAELEAMLLCLKSFGQFDGNIRCEIDRSARRQMKRIRDEMGTDQCAYFDSLDMGEHGEGM